MANKDDKPKVKQNHMHDIISDPFKKSDRVKNNVGFLARVFREILFHASIDWDEWNELMQDYLDDPQNGIPNNPRSRTTERGNQNKACASINMTWKSLMKNFYFIKGQKLRITFELTRENGDVITNQSEIILRSKKTDRKSSI